MKQTLIQPLITEKSTQLTKSKVYTFVVDSSANKHAVKQTVELVYGVKVAAVRVSVRKGKVQRVGKRMHTVTKPDYKIALVTLKDGEIDIFPKA